jgi:hypothetical protein
MYPREHLGSCRQLHNELHININLTPMLKSLLYLLKYIFCFKVIFILWYIVEDFRALKQRFTKYWKAFNIYFGLHIQFKCMRWANFTKNLYKISEYLSSMLYHLKLEGNV